MDFDKFRKAVARETVDIAQRVAPANKAVSVGVATVYAPWAAPFLALVPPDTLLATNYAIGGPWLLAIPEYRRSVEREQGEIDYTKLGEMAALAYLKGR